MFNILCARGFGQRSFIDEMRGIFGNGLFKVYTAQFDILFDIPVSVLKALPEFIIFPYLIFEEERDYEDLLVVICVYMIHEHLTTVTVNTIYVMFRREFELDFIGI